MKTHLIFNIKDKPDNLGPMHMIDDITSWLRDRKNILKDAKISSDETILTFTKEDDSEGFAIIHKVPDEFTSY
jgi:hypothetical protein